MKRLCIFLLSVICFCIAAEASRHDIPEQLLKRLPRQYAGQGRAASAMRPAPSKRAASTETAPKAYGVRIYGEVSGNDNAIVSFDVDNPGVIEEELPLDGYNIRGGVCVDGIFYLIDAPEYIAYRLLAVDINTRQIKTIATYEGLSSAEAALIITDMTYDPATGKVYLLAYDLQYEDDDYDAEQFALGMFTLDLSTGLTTPVGYQYSTNFVTLAASGDGNLYGLDDGGKLWLIDKQTGLAKQEICQTDEEPVSLQSMAFNQASNTLYWTGFSVVYEDETAYPQSFFYSIEVGDGTATPTYIDVLQDAAEIVGLYIDGDPLPKTSPAAVTNLGVTRGDNGAATATLAWTNPDATLGGDALEAGFSVNIYRNDALVATLSGQAPGADATYTDTDVPSSMVMYKVAAKNDSGEGRAVYADSLFVGRDVPGAVGNLTATGGDGYDVALQWDAPTEGANMGWFDAESVCYTITRYPGGDKLAEGITDTSFTDRTITELHGYIYNVEPVNTDGRGTSASTPNLVAGPPIESLPYECDFSTEEQQRLWTIIDNDNDGQTWYVSSNYGGVSDFFMKYFPDEELNPEKEADDWLISAPISLKAGRRYAIRYDIRLMGALFPFDYTVTAGAEATPESQTIVVVESDSTVNEMEFERIVATLTVPSNGVYHIGFHARNAVSAHFANISIGELSAADLKAVSLKGFTVVPTGSPAQFDVEITNLGSDPATAYSVSLVDGEGTELATRQFTSEVSPQATDTVTVEWTPSSKGQTTVYAMATIDGDADSSNDRTASGIDVTVTDEGAWHHVCEGTDRGMFTPFRLLDKNSTTMTIYTKAEIQAGAGQKVDGIAFYYYIFKNNPLVGLPVKIYMANTTLADWGGTNRIADDGWTLVYDGLMSCPVGLDVVPILFDTPFVYTGENLAVRCVQSSEGGNTKVSFFYNIHKDEDKDKGRLLLNYGKEPYTFADDQTLLLWNDVANASFLITGEASGIGTVSADKATAPAISYSDGTLTVAAVCNHITVCDLTGRRVAQAENCNSVPMGRCPKGIYIVSVESGGRTVATKVAIK